MPRIILIRDMLAPHRREFVPVKVGDTVTQNVPPDFPLSRAQVIHNGAVRTPGSFLDRFTFSRDEEEIILRVVPGEPFSLTMFIISVVLTIVTTALSYALRTKPKVNAPTYNNTENSPTYSFDGVQNTTANGSLLPIVYGKHRVAGQVLSAYTLADIASETNVVGQLDDSGNRLYMLIGLCAGPIGGINNYTENANSLTGDNVSSLTKVNDSAGTNFNNIEVSYRMGAWNQPIVEGFHDVIYAQPKSVELEYDTPITESTVNKIQGAQFLFRFPSGLYRIDADGSFLQYEVSIKIDYRITGAAGWEEYTTQTFSGKTRSQLNSMVELRDLPDGEYDFQFTRQTADDDSYHVSVVNLVGINEIQNDDVAFKGVALFGIKSLATEQLNGRTPNITNVVYGKECVVYYPNDDFSSDTAQDFIVEGDRKLFWGWNAYGTDKAEFAKSNSISPFVLRGKVSAATSDFSGNTPDAPQFFKCVYGDTVDVRVKCLFSGSTESDGDGVGLYVQNADVDASYYFIGFYQDGATLKWSFRANNISPDTSDSGVATSADCWFRLVCNGTTVTGYTSQDGTSWTERGSGGDNTVPSSEDATQYRKVGVTFFSDTATDGSLVADFESFSFGTDDTYSVETTSNPSWVIYDLLTDVDWGIGAYIDSSQIDLDTFIDFANYCNDQVANGRGSLHRRFQFNGVLDSANGAWETIARIVDNYRAILIKQADKIRVVWQEPKSSVALFAMSNIKVGSFSIVYESPKIGANYWEVQYANEENDYENDYAVYIDPDIESGDPYRKQAINAYGITRPAEAARLAFYKSKQNRYQRKAINFETGIDAVTVEPYDVISVQHDVPSWGIAGRVASATSTSITFDKDFDFEYPNAYTIRVRHENDTIEDRTVTPSSGSTRTVTVLEWDTTPEVGEVWVCGRQNIQTKDFIVTRIERTSDLECKIEAIDYNEDLYDDEIDRIPVVTYTTLSDPRRVPSDISHLVVSERAQLMKDGVIQSVVDVTFSSGSGAQSYEIWYREIGISSWLYAGTSRSTHFVLQSDLTVGVTYDITVISVGPFGAKKSPDQTPRQSILFKGKTGRPEDVSSISLSKSGSTLRIIWTEVSDADLGGYEIRYSDTDDDWASATFLTQTSKYTHEITTSNFPEGALYFFVKAFNTSGIPSENAASVSFTVLDPVNENVVVSRDERAEGWDGTKSNMTVVADDLVLDSGQTSGSYTTPEMDAGAVVLATVRATHIVSQTASSLTWATSTFTWGSAQAVASTWADNPEGSQFSDTLYFRYADVSLTTEPWIEWKRGEYTGRYWQFKLTVTTDAITYGVSAKELVTEIDPPDIVASGTNEGIGASGTTYVSLTGYATAPDVVVVPYNGADGDTAQVVSTAYNQFGVKYFDVDGVQSAGAINWTARGY